MSNRPSKRQRSVTRTRVASQTRTTTNLQLLDTDLGTTQALEEELLASIDPDDPEIIPMPDTIPALVRATIAVSLCDRFEFADELDLWIHASNDALGGDTPFERIVDGDGIAVLRALRASAPTTKVQEAARDAATGVKPSLRVVR